MGMAHVTTLSGHRMHDNKGGVIRWRDKGTLGVELLVLGTLGEQPLERFIQDQSIRSEISSTEIVDKPVDPKRDGQARPYTVADSNDLLNFKALCR